jgi:hypothetical protein
MRSRLLLLLSLVLALFLQARVVRADIINGKFQIDLAGWTTEGSVSWEDGEAVLRTQPGISAELHESLYQHLEIPSTAQKLSFDVWFEQAGDPDTGEGGEGASIEDFLWVSYVDDDGADFDKAFLGYDNLGAYDSNLQPLNDFTGAWFHFSAPISDLAGRYGTLYFDLNDQDNGYDSTARIDNVLIASNPIPEPTAILLLGSGLIGILGFAGKRRSR